MKYPLAFFSSPSIFTFAGGLLLASVTVAADLPEIVVSADFRQADVQSIGSSITVLQPETIERRDARHLESILNLAPNVNFSAGASRGRFVQIRGIGERSQFKDPLDASVALIVDGVDLSGIGLAGSLMDISQVEILRGPQGTRFGASALAGAINMNANKPTNTFEGSISTSLGNYDKQDFGGVVSGPLVSDVLLGRVAYQSNSSDGYIDNAFIGSDKTNNIDEQLARVSLRWLASEDLTIDFRTFMVDADNGYNAFSSFNIRDIPSDDPGHDRQETLALSTDIHWDGLSFAALQLNIFTEQSDLEYGFDWDWGNLAELGYRGSENNERERNSRGIDLRLVSKQGAEFLQAQWVAGLYRYQRDVELESVSGDNFSGFSTFSSQTDTDRVAVYGELEWQLSEQLAVILGGRWEQYALDYQDNVGVLSDPDESLWGGKLAIEYQLDDTTLLYAAVNRGYKGGGVNGQAVGKVLSDPSTDSDIANFLTARSGFNSETLLNYEIGFKTWLIDNSLSLSASAFYMDREDMQVKATVFFPPAEFRDYIDNVNGSENYGVEVETQWSVSQDLTLFASMGLLETKIGELFVEDIDIGGELNQQGRSQAHAPEYQYNIGAEYRFWKDFSLTVEMDGKDTFYFSNSHNEQSDAYELIHASVKYKTDRYAVSLWGRNLTDEDYQVRGFYFNNTPPNYAGNEAYYQFGEPRVFGVNASYHF